MSLTINKPNYARFIGLLFLLLATNACQSFDPFKYDQVPTRDVGEEPPSRLASPTLDPPTPIPTPAQKRPADSDYPAAGICASSQDNLVLISIVTGNMPDPRCMRVSSEQRLQFRNRTGKTIQIQLGQINMTLASGETRPFDVPCGDYLEPGVHRASVTEGGVPEIWVVVDPTQ